MDNTQHRQILRVLRPHGADQHDPEAQTALAAAAVDPALGAWLDREQTFDRGFAERIQSVAAPVNLRESIAAAVNFAARQRATRSARPWVIQRPFATALAALAAAASLTLLAVLLWPRSVRSVPLDDVIAAAISSTDRATRLTEHAGSPLAEVRDWFAARAAPVPGEIPAAVAELPTGGAGVVELEGITTSVVVFEAPGWRDPTAPAGPDLRLALFTLPRQSCSTAGITRTPVVRDQDGGSVAVWRDATSIYVLAVDAPALDLRLFLEGRARFVTAISRGPGFAHGTEGSRSRTG